MASVGGIVVDDVVVLLKVAVLMSLPQVGPNAGSHWGTQWQWWQPCIMVVVVGDGGSGKRWGMSHIVTFQPWLLDLATRGCLLLINSNYH